MSVILQLKEKKTPWNDLEISWLDKHDKPQVIGYNLKKVKRTWFALKFPLSNWFLFFLYFLHSKNEDQGIQSHHFMANGWETMETVTDFLFMGSKITADDNCSHEIKRGLFLRRKAITTLDSMLKSRDVTLLTKIPLVKGKIFPVITCGCESWTIKKAECWRIDAFELWYWRLLRVPWTVRRLTNQS